MSRYALHFPRREEVAGLNHHIYGLIGVAEHRDAGVSRDGLLTSLVRTGLAVGLHPTDAELYRSPNDIPVRLGV